MPPEAAGLRLDVWLTNSFPAFSRGRWQSWIRDGAVTLNGQAVKANRALQAGDRVQIHLPEKTPEELKPEDLPLSILYEDEDLLAVDKAPAMVVHPAPGHSRGTLVHALLHRLPEVRGLDEVRPGIVHRLDRDTSGILLIGKHRKAVDHLKAQFQDRHPEKHYRAIVAGHPSAEGRVDSRIMRHPTHRKKMRAHPEEGKPAHTEYTRLEQIGEAAWLDVRILTGRTHQIRVHLSSIGYPVLGDGLYGRKQKKALPAPPRIMLHAYSIQFLHPGAETPMHLTAPVPGDMTEYLDRLRSGRM